MASTLTLHRTFSNAGYCPVKRVRIYSHRWYMVAMQNVERDQGDGMYLADGEYAELLPGTEARQRRDAHLNHCNGIAEYSGPVYTITRRNGSQRPSYYPSRERAQAVVDSEHAAGLHTLATKVVPHLEAEIAATDAELEAHWGTCSDWAGPEAHRQEQRELLASNREYWRFRGEVARVR